MANPLLNGGDAAFSDENFGEQPRVFVASFDHPRIHFDGAIDKTVGEGADGVWKVER